ncbi:MAG: hypothetical protein WCR54_06405 [Clostridia bacterium]
MISWKDFNFTNQKDPEDAFENMCRIFFNYYFFDNKANFKCCHNNPGIEIEPILCNGKRISFQAKHFAKTNNYQDIYDSAKTTISNYKGQVDVIYLMCNNDLSPNAEKYKETINLFKENNIIVERFCNNGILDVIETKGYETIKQLFFGKHSFNKEFFNANLKTALEDLEPRYISGLNVDVDIQNYFEIKYMSNEVNTLLENQISIWKQSLKSFYFENPIKEKISNKINTLSVPNKNNFKFIFEWYKNFEEEKEQLSNYIKEINKKIDSWNKKDKIDKLYEERMQLSQLVGILEDINFNNNSLYNSYKSNILLIEGDAGVGKSHLLGFEAEKQGNNCCRTILLLGQKLISNNTPWEQIKTQLNISYDMNTFFEILEGMGEIDNSDTIIMLDAINECSNYSVWKQYLNEFLNAIIKYKHIKFIGTVRNTYKEQIFSYSILEKIKKNEIILITHNGFDGVIDEAVTKYFKYYKIPITTMDYLAYEYNNPLFLKIFCMTYSSSESLGSNGIITMFRNYITEEEKKIKELLNIENSFSYCYNILGNLASYFYENNVKSINILKLYEINKDISNSNLVIEKMLKSKLLVSYYYEDKQIVYFGYERICDFMIAQIITNCSQNYEDIKVQIINKLLQVNKNGNLIKSNALGIFSALSIIVSEKYKEEILDIIDEITINKYLTNQFIKEYITNLVYRKNDSICKEKIQQTLKKHITNKEQLEILFNVYLLLAGRLDNPLNAFVLDDYLKSKPLNIRDSIWTIFINQNYYVGTNLFHTINYFINNEFKGNKKQKLLYLIELMWFLTSSNRLIRDKTSRILVSLMKDDIESMEKILEMFNDVNDPYVAQRLYAIFYGAILKSSEISKDELSNFCGLIFKYVFNKNIVYEDILLRDYALNIIEYAKYLRCKLSFDIKKCRPPYNTNPIPEISKEVEKDFEFHKELGFTGANAIKSSLTPNINGGYGDFGRYVFESALSYFKNINIKNLYLYALKYIKDDLGYENEMFSDYDRQVQRMEGYNRHNTAKIERIGKKYEWISFYRILAIVSDHNKLDGRYRNEKSIKYRGSWNPYVRDFDPTLDLINNDKIYNFDLGLKQPQYNNWDFDNLKWAECQNDVMDFEKYIDITDNKDNSWMFLHGNIMKRSMAGYDKDYREVWRMISAYFINTTEYDSFIEKLSPEHFWGRWFPESRSNYSLFSREFCWSPGYKAEFKDEKFEIEVDTGTTKKVKINIPLVDILNNTEKDGTIKIRTIKNNPTFYNQKIRKVIGSVIPSWNEYMWEEQYDASKEDVVSYYLPSSILMENLQIKQPQNGIFTINNEIIAIDFSLVRGNVEGLYIKRDVLFKFLKEHGLNIFWVCIGEKNDIKKDSPFTQKEGSNFKDMSSLIYIKDDKYIPVNKFRDRNEH